MRRLRFLVAPLLIFVQTPRAETPPAPRPTPRQVAWRVLSSVHFALGKAQASVQPYLLLHLAENTVEFNKKLALVEFRDAFADSRILETTYRAPLQAQIVGSAAPVDVPTAIDLLRAIRPNPSQRYARDHWDRSVAVVDSQLLGRNRPDEALELIKLVATPGLFPNLAASNMMSALPPADDRRIGMFGYAAACYRQVPFPGFSMLLKDHWRTMPRSLVVLAADAVADEESSAGPGELADVLPILREVDPPRAERLLNEHPDLPDKPPPQPRKPAYQPQNPQDLIDRVSQMSRKYPGLALSMASSIQDPDTRKQAILQVAAEVLRSGADPDIAGRAMDLLLKLPVKSQLDLAPQLAALAAYTGKSELALQYIDAAFELAAKLLEADLDAKSECGVNPAPKDWWPSTAAYRAAVHAAVSLLQTSAERYLSRVQDGDLYLLMNVEFARALMGGGPSSTPRLTCNDAVAVLKEAHP